MKLGIFLSLLLGACAVQGAIVSNVFGSNMVLQRAPLSASLFGWSSSGDSITVNFNNAAKYQATAGSDGSWNVSLDPQPAGGPYTIIVLSQANPSATVNLTNIMFGDVILCGGQSNMQFTVNEVFNATQALAAASNYTNLRLFTVGQTNTSTTPFNELAMIEQGWSVASPTALGQGAGAFSIFSAVCWFTAVNILNTFPTLPIGLISSNWGGTIIQAWSSPDALALCPQTGETATDYKPAVNTQMYSVKGQPGPGADSALWNAMIVPFLNVKLSAFLWYQAEANVGQTDLYRCLFPAMINDWRAKWGLGNIPFFFAQLAPYTTDGPMPFWYSLADMRLAQAAGLNLPNTALISTIDSGDWDNPPFTDIHPRDKQVVGYRMSLAALNILYDMPEVIHSGPTLDSATIASNYPNVNVILNFLPNTIGQGLEFRNATCPPSFDQYCSTWELGFSDGSWHEGAASVVSNVAVSVTLASSFTGTVNVTGVRYLYSDWPVATLYSSSTGLPASPFYFPFVQ